MISLACRDRLRPRKKFPRLTDLAAENTILLLVWPSDIWTPLVIAFSASALLTSAALDDRTSF